MDYLALDESGHGSIAGPMTVGLVRVSSNFNEQTLWDIGICDSKLTTEETRVQLYRSLKDHVTLSAIKIPVTDINNYKHNQCFDAHIRHYLKRLDPKGIELFVDGLRVIDGVDKMGFKATYIINGDLSNAMIAAASIVAKYTHDQEINQLDSLYPEWDFKHHRGYPLPDHAAKIVSLGPIPGVHKLNPTYTTITNYCKKNELPVPDWASSKDRLRQVLCD